MLTDAMLILAVRPKTTGAMYSQPSADFKKLQEPVRTVDRKLCAFEAVKQAASPPTVLGPPELFWERCNHTSTYRSLYATEMLQNTESTGNERMTHPL